MSHTATSRPKTRSPNYPGIDLKTAIDKAKELFKKIVRHPVGPQVAIQSMGYTAKSSTGMVALGALRQFGLIENAKLGTESLVKMSSLGLDIVTDYVENSPEWIQAVKRAVLNPKIHNELWNRYGATPPPDDELKRYLIREKAFGDSAVGAFITTYKASIGFAKLSADDKLDDTTGQENDGDGDMLATDKSFDDKPTDERREKPKNSPPTDGSPYIAFPLANGNMLEVRLRRKVSQKDFDRIKQIIDLSEDSLVEDDDVE